ncbi:Protein of unknown function (DUF1445) [Fragilaria crotonensis]|nr:Protein of unknown function (DUF1445) [Fragilaria crotonensis]
MTFLTHRKRRGLEASDVRPNSGMGFQFKIDRSFRGRTDFEFRKFMTTKALSDAERAIRMELLLAALPACQPQEGSPANTFTTSELEELRAVLKDSYLGPRDPDIDAMVASAPRMDIFNPKEWRQPLSGDADSKLVQNSGQEQDDKLHHVNIDSPEHETLGVEDTWYGAPIISKGLESQRFRQEVRHGRFARPTNGQCPGFLQCNLVVLPQGQHAFDFLLFCQRNKKACPLIEVCDVGSPHPKGVARDADLRTDLPKYAIYRDGPYDGAFIKAGIPLRSAEAGKNVPMYRTNLPCRSSGSLSGNMVVSMKPIKALDIAKEVEITSQYPHAHGPPVCVGNAKSIGITDLENPDWGDAIDVREDEIPVFHACGVTPQSVLMDSRVPFAITHSAGYMFVTDLPSDVAI